MQSFITAFDNVIYVETRKIEKQFITVKNNLLSNSKIWAKG